MPARDVYHDAVRNALIKDGWTITHDPYLLSFGFRDVFVDLGAERLIAAEKDSEKIAVEIKTFLGASEIRDFELAVGQYIFCHSLLTRTERARRLFLAVPEEVALTLFNEPITRPVLEDLAIKVLTFDPRREVVTEWRI
jgi:hypothetical protein